MNDKKRFRNLPADEYPQFYDDGIKIYRELIQKYPKPTIEDRDNILNALCASLYLLISQCVDKDNYENALQLIHDIIKKNLNRLFLPIAPKM